MSPEANPWYACTSVLVETERGRTDHVKEGKVLLGLDQFGQFLPLLLGGIDTSWVLGTSVEQELSSAPYLTAISR